MLKSLSETASILGKSVSQIHRLVREGAVKGVPDGRRLLVDVDDVAGCFCPSCGALRRDRDLEDDEDDL